MNKLSEVKKIICFRSFWVLWGVLALSGCIVLPIIDMGIVRRFYWQPPLLLVVGTAAIAFVVCLALRKNNLINRIERKLRPEEE